jgi:hypothetical protein
MKFIVLVKANPDSEKGVMPDEKILAAMGKFNEELAKAGVILDLNGLHPSSKGARLKFEGGKRTITDGPFPETKELVAGYWVLQCKSREECIEWMKRAPFDGGTEIEIRQIFDPSEFDMTEETKALHQSVANQVYGAAKS